MDNLNKLYCLLLEMSLHGFPLMDPLFAVIGEYIDLEGVLDDPSNGKKSLICLYESIVRKALIKRDEGKTVGSSYRVDHLGHTLREGQRIHTGNGDGSAQDVLLGLHHAKHPLWEEGPCALVRLAYQFDRGEHNKRTRIIPSMLVEPLEDMPHQPCFSSSSWNLDHHLAATRFIGGGAGLACLLLIIANRNGHHPIHRGQSWWEGNQSHHHFCSSSSSDGMGESRERIHS